MVVAVFSITYLSLPGSALGQGTCSHQENLALRHNEYHTKHNSCATEQVRIDPANAYDNKMTSHPTTLPIFAPRSSSCNLRMHDPPPYF